MQILKQHKSFGGVIRFFEHDSTSTQTKMKFSTFTPSGEVKGCVIWLSGLECTEETFMIKSGAQRSLAAMGLMVICPDTSPRGLQLPGEHDSWDFGSGAGFYVDATTPGYRDNYRMYSYVAHELYSLIQREFGVADRISIMGHSMGGHGALVIGLREVGKFKSISAFAPIVNPSQVPWGMKAFTGYLGHDQSAWSKYDAIDLLRAGERHPQPLLVDQGTADGFLEKQLQTSCLKSECEARNQKLQLRFHEGYDHGYYFISTLIEDHVRFHHEHLVGKL